MPVRVFKVLIFPRVCYMLTYCVLYVFNFHSGVAQWLACWTHNPNVHGSKPCFANIMTSFDADFHASLTS